ncbi:MAG: glycosyltransferase family 2 protein [bacterium]|nr:MAG: glycosyltransferase family 2 protein [bacterium]
MPKISVVINTLNDQKKIGRCLASLKSFANEIVVVDMMSSDQTREIAKKYRARVFKHKRISFVEPARNFAISKTKYDWIVILDADEELTEELKSFIKKELRDPKADYYRVPRKNIIFGKWIKHTGWWPDYNIRFFKKGHVSWNQLIHSVPVTTGRGFDLTAKEGLAIKHKAYSSVEDYISRMNRYTTVQSRELNRKNVEFVWSMLISKPLSEFLRRFFAESGYRDGLHGLALSLLQAFSEVVVYSKLWQKQKFKKVKVPLGDVGKEFFKSFKEIEWWLDESKIRSSKNIFRRIWLKILRRL